MRPYIAHIGPELAADIMKAAAQGSNPDKMNEACRLWKTTVAHGITNALIDNFEQRMKPVRMAVEQGVELGTAADDALEDVLTPLAPIVGFDWAGQPVGVLDPLSDEAMEALFIRAGKQAAEDAWQAGVKARESVNKFLAHEHITLEGITKMTDPNKPFLDFLDNVVTAASETFGDEWTATRLHEGTDEALALLLQCSVFPDNADNIASLRHAVSLLPADKPAEAVNTASDFATARAEGMEPKVQEVPHSTGHAQAIETIRKYSGLGDPDIGALLGVSRGTVGNLAQGKAKKPMTPEGRAALAQKVREIMSELALAAGALEA